MKKIKLDLSNLKVSSFEVACAPSLRGTVVGRQTEGCPPSAGCASQYCQTGAGCSDDCGAMEVTNTCFFSDLCTTVLPPL